MIITEIQKKEIEQLIPEHKEALVAFGADMYRRGLITGAVWLAIGVGCGVIIEVLAEMYKHRKSEKESEGGVLTRALSSCMKGEKMGLKNKSDTFLVSFDYTHGDIPVLIIGRRGKEKEIDIINAFQGDEASELYKKLTDKKVSG